MEVITNKRPTRSLFTVAATWMTVTAPTRRQRSMAHRFTTRRRVITHHLAITRRHAITRRPGITPRRLVITVPVPGMADALATVAATGMAGEAATTAAPAIVLHLPDRDRAAAAPVTDLDLDLAGMATTEAVVVDRLPADPLAATTVKTATSVAAVMAGPAVAIAENQP